jgi:ribose-phosphate pyrophosphokinase
MIVFTTSSYYKRFVRPLLAVNPEFTVGNCEISRFTNGEMHVRIHDNVSSEDCLVVSSMAPPDEQLLSLLMITDALKQNGARSIRAFLPYLGYGRQDKFEPGEGSGITLMGSLLQTAGVDEIITIDTHSKLDEKLIGLPLTSQSSSSLFIAAIQSLDWGDNVTIVAPDEGAITRAQMMADALGVSHPVAHLVKKHVDGIVHLNLFGEVSTRVLIVDDIIDSGRTLVSACNVLRDRGVQDIAVIVTHGLFTGGAWKRLFGLGVRTIFVSDSCPEATAQRHPNVHVILLKPLLPAIFPKITRKEKQYENVTT